MIGARGNRELFNRNLTRIFLALKDGSPLSKNDLCQRLELSRPTVDRAISQLLDSGFVRQDGRGPSAGGRRAILYAIDSRARYTVGGDLEIPELNIVVSGLDEVPVVSKSLTIPSHLVTDPQKTLSFVAKSIEDVLREAGIPLQRIVGIGLGVPAFLRKETITISGRNLPHWVRVPAKQTLEQTLGVPVFVNNDVKFMSLAEHRAMGYRDRVMAYLALRRGLQGDIRMGGSILINGKLFHGGNGNAGALYHAYVEANETSQSASDDPTAIVDLLADRLLEPIVHLLHLFDPNRLVVNATTLGKGEEAFINALSSRLERMHYEGVEHGMTVTAAREQNFSCAKGGALFALEKALQRPIELIT